MPNLPDLDWQPVLLVKVTREPFTGTRCGVPVSHTHIALHHVPTSTTRSCQHLERSVTSSG